MADLVTTIPALDPGDRLLCGPGPSNVHPDVLEAMRLPMNGHLDPDFWDILLDLVAGLRALWRAPDGRAHDRPVVERQLRDGGRVPEPDRARRQGDLVPLGLLRVAAQRLRASDRRRRRGAHAPTSGRSCRVDRIMEAVDGEPRREDRERRPRRDLDRRRLPARRAGARRCAPSGSDALLYADCVTSLGGQQVEADAWGLDFAYSCSQKSLGCPPGLAPGVDQPPRDRGDGEARTTPVALLLRLRGARAGTGSTGRSPTTTRCRSCSTTRSTRA